MFSKLRQYIEYRRVFRSHADIQRFRRARDHPESGGRISLRVREAAGPLICRLRTMDPITLWDALHSGYHLPLEPLGPGWIVDLGANAGYTAAHLAFLYPAARVLAVEMDPENAALCRQNVSVYGPRVLVLRAAIWCENGAVRYGGSDVHDLAIDHTADRSAPAVTVDTLFATYGIDRVAYLKIDIEGAEREVIATDAKWLRRVDQIGLEAHPPGRYADFAGRLEAAGFTCRPHPKHPWGLCAHRLSLIPPR
jgi:31-O-methyltransferase